MPTTPSTVLYLSVSLFLLVYVYLYYILAHPKNASIATAHRDNDETRWTTEVTATAASLFPNHPRQTYLSASLRGRRTVIALGTRRGGFKQPGKGRANARNRGERAEYSDRIIVCPSIYPSQTNPHALALHRVFPHHHPYTPRVI